MSRYTPLFLILHALFYMGCSHDETKKTTPSSSFTIASIDDPHTLDPRLMGDLSATTISHMLFEGLMRTNANGILEPAIANHVTISEDLKTYTFKLRPSEWSDGTPLTAEDFAETWLSTLAPNFLARNAYQLFMIKGAKQFKDGLISKKLVGVKATSPDTLVVELEHPTPYFLELTSCHFYFPVHPETRSESTDKEDAIIGNGPFKQNRWEHRSVFEVVKNPLYWDANAVHLDTITLQILDEATALQLFKAGSLSWVGSPLSTLPQDAVASLKQEGSLQILPGAGTHWFRFNTERPPFTSEKLRRAFALALDRQAIVDHVTQGNQRPAIGIIPPSFGFNHQDYYKDHDIEQAQKLFKEAVEENWESIAAMPQVTLLYAANDRNHKIAQAVQHQWNQAFNINLLIESGEQKIVTDRMRSGKYQMSVGSWYADILDPINFLEIFQSRDTPTNQTFWHNGAYTALLEKSALEQEPKNRLKTLNDAEKILMEGMPVAPLFYSAFNYLKTDKIKGVYFSPLGYLDFKQAFFDEDVQ